MVLGSPPCGKLRPSPSKGRSRPSSTGYGEGGTRRRWRSHSIGAVVGRKMPAHCRDDAMIGIRLVLTAVLSLAAAAAQAQTFPSKPIRLVSPFPAGGPNDAAARIAARAMQGRLGQTGGGREYRRCRRDARRPCGRELTARRLHVAAGLRRQQLGHPAGALQAWLRSAPGAGAGRELRDRQADHRRPSRRTVSKCAGTRQPTPKPIPAR